MDITKLLCLFGIIFLVSCQTNSTVTQDTLNPDCKLSTAAEARVTSSPCFAELKTVISCMPLQEQDLWANANAKNTNTTKCFDCSLVKNSMKDSFKKNADGLAQKMTQQANEKRKSLSCFASFAKSTLTSDDINSINSSLQTIVANQKKNGQAAAQMLQGVSNVFIGRRRLLCMPNAARAKLSVNDAAAGTVKDFVYNLDDATRIVNAFLGFMQTKISTISSIANEVSSMSNVVANSANCASTAAGLLRYLQSTPAPASGSTTPSGSSLPASGASASAPKPSGSGPNPGKVNGKSLGADVTGAVTTVSTAISALKSTGALDFVQRISNSFNGAAQNCQPSGFNNFASNLNLSGTAKSTLLNLIKLNSLCQADAIYILSNGNLSCEGSCGSFTTVQLAFVDVTKTPQSYYFASGCATGKRFIYGTWSDLTTPSTIYTTFVYDKVNSDKRCLAKAAGCVPGGKMTGGNPSDGACAGSSMNKKCGDGLNKKCSDSGLASQVSPPPEGLPYGCDAAAQGLDATSEAFIANCFKFIAKSFIRRSLSFSPDKLVSDSTVTETPARILQESDATIIPVSQDTSISSNEFVDVTLTSTDVQVDGSTPTSTGSTTSGMTEIDTAGTTVVPSSSSSSNSLTFSFIVSMISILAILI